MIGSSDHWFETEVEGLVRGLLADEVEHGFTAWLVEDHLGEITAVGAHVGLPHPSNEAELVTYIAILAVSSARRGPRTGRELSILLKSMFEDILLTNGRSPFVYQKVANENERMRLFLERSGFNSAEVPSDPRYLYYSAQIGGIPSIQG